MLNQTRGLRKATVFATVLTLKIFNSYGQDKSVTISPALLSSYVFQTGFSVSKGNPLGIMVLPVVRRTIYAELRYNYDQENTLGLFGGKRFILWNDSGQVVTPQYGFLIGAYRGAGPQLYYQLSRPGLEINFQNQYIFSVTRKASFYYNWSDIQFPVFKGFRTGVSAQLYDSETTKSIDVGLLVGYKSKKNTYVLYAFNLYQVSKCFLYFGVQRELRLLSPNRAKM